MRLALSGSSGMIGRALVPALLGAGHECRRLVRRAARPGADERSWVPEEGRLESGALDGVDAVVHLAGENVAGGRWTAGRKERIRASRVQGTRALAEAAAAQNVPPRVLISASAVGYYGDRGSERLSERSGPGRGFLAEVCQEWEAALESAREAGIRTVAMRLGMVLGPRGGALGRMLPLFRLGLGGRLGPGRQWVSWVALDDVVGAIVHVLSHEKVEGPVNVVAPEPVTNDEFSRRLGEALSRPTLLPVPGPALRIVLGELADGLLLASARVEPSALLESGYVFSQPRLSGALKSVVAPTGS